MSQPQITELTDEQKALLPKYRDDQIAESRRTDEADFKAAEPIIRRMLEVSNIELSPNFRFIHCRNPSSPRKRAMSSPRRSTASAARACSRLPPMVV
jgi:hypothetical protein